MRRGWVLTAVAATALAAAVALRPRPGGTPSAAPPRPAPLPVLPAEPAVPEGYAVMPESAACIFEDANAERPGEYSWVPTARADGRDALSNLRRVPFPDPTRAERVRVRIRKDWSLPGWRTASSLEIDFAHLYDRVAEGTIEPVDFGAELDEVLAVVRAAREGRKFTGTRLFEIPDTGAVALLRNAVAAVRLGREADARILAEHALTEDQRSLRALLESEAERCYLRGARLLEGGAPRESVLGVWRAVEPWAEGTKVGPTLTTLVADLAAQLQEDATATVGRIEHFGALPPAERAAAYVARFPEVRGKALASPGDAWILRAGEGTIWSDAAVALGRAAAPALLAALEDRRLTRTMHRGDLGMTGLDAIRVQDVALACLQSIANVQIHDGGCLSLLPPEQRRDAVRRIRAWWGEHGDEPEAARRLATLRVGDVWGLREIARLDPSAVDVAETLRRWAETAKGDTFVHIADALAAHGDASLLPRVRELASHAATSHLLRYGDASDVRKFAALQRASRRRGGQAGSPAWHPAVGQAAANVARVEMTPLLVDILDDRDPTGSRVSSDGKCSVEWSPSDDAMVALARLTGRDAGYDRDGTLASRSAAIDAWLAWWRSDGAAEFAKAHPELADLVVAVPPSNEEVERALQRSLVEVPSPAAAMAVHGIPASALRTLLADGSVIARRGPLGGAEFEFAGADAEVEWSARAATSSDGAVPTLTVHAAVAFVDSRRRLWCLARQQDARFRRFDGRWTDVPRTVEDASWSRAGPGEALSGADGALLLVDREDVLHLFDDDGHASAAGIVALVETDGDRLRRALAVRSAAQVPSWFKCALDDLGRIWWWDSREGLLVLGPGTVLRGATPALGDGRGAARRLDLLVPLGKGRVGAFADDGQGAVLEVRDGAVVQSATLAVPRRENFLHRIHVATGGQVFVHGRPLSLHGVPEFTPSRPGTLAAVSADGGLWFLTNDRRVSLTHVPADGPDAVFALPGDDSISAVAADGAAGAWVLARKSLLRLRREGERLVEVRRIAVQSYGTLAAGPDGVVWLLGSGAEGRTVRMFLDR